MYIEKRMENPLGRCVGEGRTITLILQHLGSLRLHLFHTSILDCEIGVCSIFLHVDRSINEIHKPRVLGTKEIFSKNYVFIYY